jgi:4-amino-4-deoxy-L-arabinose transferase-like glycosyltransferase
MCLSGRRALIAIVILASALRLYPLWFGLPYPEARPDEETAVAKAMAITSGDFNPHFFHWPSLTFYAFAAAYAAATSVVGPLTPGQQIIIGRALVATAGTLTVLVLFWIGRRVADEETGLLAAFFLAIAVLHVRDSHFAMTDVPMTLLAMVSLAALLRALDTRPDVALPWFAAAGFAAGLATSTKYSAAALIAAMGAAQVMVFANGERPWHARAWLPSVLFAAMMLCGFVVGTPYALLDYPAFATDFQYDVTHLSGGHANLVLGRGWVYHLTHSLPYGAGLSLFVAALAGVAPLLRRFARPALVVAAFGAAFYAAIGSGYTVFFRYILPLIPLLCLSAAVAVRVASQALARRAGLSLAAATTVVTVLVAGPTLVTSVWMDVLLSRTDTRVLAADWLNARIQPGESLHDTGNGYTRLMVWKTSNRWTYDEATGRFSGDASRVPDWLVVYQSPIRAYAAAPAALRTLAATHYQLAHTVRGTRGLAALAVYDRQDAFFLPFSRLHTVERPGPTVQIYRRTNPSP